jgi:hypothetical protein
MKLQNKPAILKAYWRFVVQFILLLGSLLLIVWLFLHALTEQLQQLSAHKVRYTDVVFTQRLLGQRVDSIYHHLTLLNKSPQRINRMLEQRIVHENNELEKELDRAHLKQGPHAVFYRITRGVNEILQVKDSIRVVEVKSNALRQELSDCQQTAGSTTK